MNNETEQVMEQLSALLDGELDTASQASLTRRLLVDAELGRRWQSYHRVGELLRGEWTGGSPGFAQRVSAAIAEEAPLKAPVFQLRPLGETATRVTKTWLRPVAGMALAASVAVVTVFSVRLLDASGPVRDAPPAMAEADPVAQKATATALATVTAETDKDKRLALKEPPPVPAPSRDVKLVDYE